MTMYSAYLASLRLALERDMCSDTFVIKKTVGYLDKMVEDVCFSNRLTIEDMDRMLDEYFQSEPYLESVLNILFLRDKQTRIHEMNERKLREFHSKIKDLLNKNP